MEKGSTWTGRPSIVFWLRGPRPPVSTCGRDALSGHAAEAVTSGTSPFPDRMANTKLWQKTSFMLQVARLARAAFPAEEHLTAR
jgi:hypothetical protein